VDPIASALKMGAKNGLSQVAVSVLELHGVKTLKIVILII
jgi:hypothetical protein